MLKVIVDLLEDPETKEIRVTPDPPAILAPLD